MICVKLFYISVLDWGNKSKSLSNTVSLIFLPRFEPKFRTEAEYLSIKSREIIFVSNDSINPYGIDCRLQEE